MRMRVRHHPLGFLELGVVVQLTRELGIDDFDRHAGLVECSERGLRALDLALVGQCPGERGVVRGGVRRDAVRFEQRRALWSTRRSDADPAVTGFAQAMRSDEITSKLHSPMCTSYTVYTWKKQTNIFMQLPA